MLKRLLLGLLVAWAAAGLLSEMSTALSSYDRRAQVAGSPTWRFGAPEPRRLVRCLGEARQAMRPGSIVAFASPDVPPGAAFEHWRWAAYLLPAYDVVPADDPAVLELADYAVAYDRRMAAPGVEPVLLGLLGSRFSAALAAPGDGVLFRAVVDVMGGTVVLHLLLTALDLAGVPWHPLVLAILGAALYFLARRFLPRGAERARLTLDPGWGDGLALFALAAFTLPALTGWTATPDFVYHWGLKGHRFSLAGGVDYAYLGRGWNWVLHPDYPNLLPEIFAVSAMMAGDFHLPAMMLQSGIVFALLLAAVREGLRQGGTDRFSRQAGLALVALVGGAFGIGHLMAGGADWMIAMALAAAVPPLLRPPDRAGDFQIGVIAAFAAASKIEGVPLAAFLVLVQWARRRRRLDLAAAARLALPPAAVVFPWLAETMRHHLFLENNSGPFDPARAGAIFAAVSEALLTPAARGFLLLSLLPPLLLFHRRLRPFAAVGTLQLLFCLYIYFTAVVGDQIRIFVLSNGARLAFQLVPASLLAGLVAWGGILPPACRPTNPSDCTSARETSA